MVFFNILPCAVCELPGPELGDAGIHILAAGSYIVDKDIERTVTDKLSQVEFLIIAVFGIEVNAVEYIARAYDY